MYHAVNKNKSCNLLSIIIAMLCKQSLSLQTALFFLNLEGSGSMDTSSKAADENEICKVCMDRVIDCVFLECGHLVTCVDCGRQLRECPLCRQNIVRTVRVFKS